MNKEILMNMIADVYASCKSDDVINLVSVLYDMTKQEGFSNIKMLSHTINRSDIEAIRNKASVILLKKEMNQ